MSRANLEKLRYPIGKWQRPDSSTRSDCDDWIDVIERLPADLRAAVARLQGKALDAPYRPGGWTRRQVVHHVADSHMNSYMRFRLAMTEDRPTIRPYDEAAWAELEDARTAPVEVSLRLIEALHERWGRLLRSFTDVDLRRAFVHPEIDGDLRLDETLSLYAWHGSHHVAHILLPDFPNIPPNDL